jgi:hypothetical protein
MTTPTGTMPRTRKAMTQCNHFWIGAYEPGAVCNEAGGEFRSGCMSLMMFSPFSWLERGSDQAGFQAMLTRMCLMFSRRSASTRHQLAAFPLETQAEFATSLFQPGFSRSCVSRICLSEICPVAASAVDHPKVS